MPPRLRSPWLYPAAGLGFGLASLAAHDLAYPALGLMLLGVATRATTGSRVVTGLVRFSYEFYLLHGLFFVACARVIPAGHPYLIAPCGVGSSLSW